METEGCKTCKSFFVCELKKFLPFPENGCSDYVSAKKKEYIALVQNLNTKNWTILGFSDSHKELLNIVENHSCYEKINYRFLVVPNLPVTPAEFDDIKDECLLKICNNVAYVLSRAEIHMFRHSYKKSKFCFDKTKSLIADACNILDNY